MFGLTCTGSPWRSTGLPRSGLLGTRATFKAPRLCAPISAIVVIALSGACQSAPRSRSVSSAPPQISTAPGSSNSDDPVIEGVSTPSVQPTRPVGVHTGGSRPVLSGGESTTTALASCFGEHGAHTGSTADGSAATVMNLTNVEITRLSACSDVVKFSFANPSKLKPAFKIFESQGPFVKAGSGAAVSIPGTKFLVVRFEPASTYDFAAGTPTYGGSDTIRPPVSATVQQAVMIDDAEGVVTWVIGIDVYAGYDVLTTTAPSTLQLTVHR